MLPSVVGRCTSCCKRPLLAARTLRHTQTRSNANVHIGLHRLALAHLPSFALLRASSFTTWHRRARRASLLGTGVHLELHCLAPVRVLSFGAWDRCTHRASPLSAGTCVELCHLAQARTSSFTAWHQCKCFVPVHTSSFPILFYTEPHKIVCFTNTESDISNKASAWKRIWKVAAAVQRGEMRLTESEKAFHETAL